jgi:glutathione S-transferase
MNTNTRPILYSFRRCPYAMRARMAIYIAGIDVQKIEVELKSKPQSLLHFSPKGTVPVVVTAQGNVIDQSRDIMHWALTQADPENWLFTGNILRQLQTIQLVDECDNAFKPLLDRYKYFDRYPEHSQLHYRQQAEVFLQKLENCLTQQTYLVDNHRRFADIAIFPFIRQFASVDSDWFSASPYPHLQHWLQRCVSSTLFQSIMVKD